MVGSDQDDTLDSLLMLNGEIFPMDNGYWTKFEAYLVEQTLHTPHGIRYCLTLHDRYNRWVLGFDNAHGIKTRKKRFAARKTTWDHQHQGEKVVSYEFETAGQLLDDFWEAVEVITSR